MASYGYVIKVLIHLKRGTAFRRYSPQALIPVLPSLNPLEAWNCFQTRRGAGDRQGISRRLNPLEAWNCFQTRRSDGDLLRSNRVLIHLKRGTAFRLGELGKLGGENSNVLIHLKRGTAFRRTNFEHYSNLEYKSLNPLEAWNCFQTIEPS